MASIDDVSGALKSAVITALNTLPIANTIDVMVGWPNMPALTKLLEQGRSVVSIVPLPTEKLTTRFFPIPYIIVQPPNTLAVTVSGNTVTFSGMVVANLNVMTVVNTNTPYASPARYQTTGSDTLDSVATGAAASVNALGLSGVSALASGATVTVDGISGIVCNVGAVGTVGQEVRRTERQFQISTFTPGDAQTSLTPVSTSRSMIVNAIDQTLATLYFLQLPDTSYGRLKYVRGPWNDDMQRETMLIANQIFSVEFATLATAPLAQVTAVEVTETPTLPNGQPGPSVTFTVGN